MRSFLDIIKLWPSDTDFARDINVRPNHLRPMKVRESIPAEYSPALVTLRGAGGLRASRLSGSPA